MTVEFLVPFRPVPHHLHTNASAISHRRGEEESDGQARVREKETKTEVTRGRREFGNEPLRMNGGRREMQCCSLVVLNHDP